MADDINVINTTGKPADTELYINGKKVKLTKIIKSNYPPKIWRKT